MGKNYRNSKPLSSVSLFTNSHLRIKNLQDSLESLWEGKIGLWVKNLSYLLIDTFRLEIVGKYGLKNKREVWRIQLTLAKMRKAARELLTLDEKDPRRLFEGEALMRRCFRFGLLSENENKLDYVLGLTPAKFMERRLQTIILRNNFEARSIHHARVLIRQRHIR